MDPHDSQILPIQHRALALLIAQHVHNRSGSSNALWRGLQDEKPSNFPNRALSLAPIGGPGLRLQLGPEEYGKVLSATFDTCYGST
ncbi:MAG: hypothetical protein AABZ53_12230, partial [Planctomycetota bacterium]